VTGTVSKGTVAVIFVTGDAEVHLPTLVSLRRSDPDLPVLCGAPDPAVLQPLVDLGAEAVRADSTGALVNVAWEGHRSHVLVIDGNVVFPSHGISSATGILDGDLRVATVSLLSNDAGWLSFPYRDQPSVQLPPGLDEEEVTCRLRTAPDLAPVPISMATGPAVLLSSLALSALWPLVGLSGITPGITVAEFSARARQKGFVDVCDPSTFCLRFGGDHADQVRQETNQALLDEVLQRHPALEVAVEQDRSSDTSPLGIAHRVCRTKVLGLRLLIDGSCLGPREMGTQVQTLALIEALARHDDVERVHVALAVPPVGWTRRLALHPKIELGPAPRGDISAFPHVDVLHRPFQPDGYMDMRSWSGVAARTVITVLDLIAYQVAPYHDSPATWMAYRRLMQQTVTKVDAIVVPSDDVRRQLELERLPVEPQRLAVVGLGSDHLGGQDAETVPRGLLARGMVSNQFALVLGSDYGHKNRDLAIRTVEELRARGHDLFLVLVGAAVPYGSSRILEARATAELRDGLVVLPDASTEERNWLLRHASLVLYPTSAEGFGFIPYEAAYFGTPVVLVGVGPLAPLADQLPVVASDWHPSALADAAERLLTDPALAACQSATVLEYGLPRTWDAAAAELVQLYRELLSRPPLRGEPGSSSPGPAAAR
jgi:glycosyltransferase involved in cell wall biosynthesis